MFARGTAVIPTVSALASNCFAPIVANKDKFKTQLSVKAIEVIETVTRISNAQTVISDSTMAISRERSETAERRAWLAPCH